MPSILSSTTDTFAPIEQVLVRVGLALDPGVDPTNVAGIGRERLRRRVSGLRNRRPITWPTPERIGPFLRPLLSSTRTVLCMTVLRSIALFVLAAVAEIGGAYLVWQGVREKRGLVFVGAGVVALGLYGFFATFQPSPHFGRILAAYGGVFVAGSLAWGIIFDGFRPDRYDIMGALICLVGVAVIMYAPRAAQ